MDPFPRAIQTLVMRLQRKTFALAVGRSHLSCLLLLFLTLYSLRGSCLVLGGLYCFRFGPDSGMNCTWTVEGEPSPDIVYTLYYRSNKYHSRQRSPAAASIPRGQSWGVIARENLTAYDTGLAWVEGVGAGKKFMSLQLEIDLQAIVVKRPPVLSVEGEPRSDSGNVMVSCEPSEREQQSSGTASCELRYRELGTPEWIQGIIEGVEILDLAPHTRYEVQARYPSLEGYHIGSDWSLPLAFRSPEAAPLGTVDAWRSLEGGGSRLLVMWKALDSKSARSFDITYAVSYRERGGSRRVLNSLPCCNISLPGTVDDISVSANNSLGVTKPCNLSLSMPVPSRGPAFTVQGLSSTSAVVSLRELPLLERRGIIKQYTVYLTRAESCAVLQQYNVSEAQDVVLRMLQSSTSYMLNVTASTSAGESTSSVYYFVTPGVSLGIVIGSILVTVCLVASSIFGLLFYRRIRSLGQAVLPKFFWQKIPDPVHSKLVLKLHNGKDMDEESSSRQWIPDPHGALEEHPITEVEEMEILPSDPPATEVHHGTEKNKEAIGGLSPSLNQHPSWMGNAKAVPASPAPVEWHPPIMSGYERHFMPSPEDLAQCT
ncbi:interleukin-27 receptor subunit alpha isoform X4 [Ambystoma mexicanum]|uniref:interleukin-27 receptor subunit alpha isoform X4 n=1 Tax=Ambystoma mexicanum TaxID=8296 RepID=UPI0037E8BEA1